MTISYYRFFGEVHIVNGDIVGIDLFCVFFRRRRSGDSVFRERVINRFGKAARWTFAPASVHEE